MARLRCDRKGASRHSWNRWENASLAILINWASIFKEAAWITLKLLTDCGGVNDTLSKVGNLRPHPEGFFHGTELPSLLNSISVCSCSTMSLWIGLCGSFYYSVEELCCPRNLRWGHKFKNIEYSSRAFFRIKAHEFS